MEILHIEDHPLLVRRLDHPTALLFPRIPPRIIRRLDDTCRLNEMTAAHFAGVDEEVRRGESLASYRRVRMEHQRQFVPLRHHYRRFLETAEPVKFFDLIIRNST